SRPASHRRVMCLAACISPAPCAFGGACRTRRRCAPDPRQPAAAVAALADVAPTGETMIRALALLSVTMLAACFHSSHASPPPGPPPGSWAAQPEDPYGEAVATGSRSCAPGSTCSFECPEGGCAFSRAQGRTCNLECDGGRCKTSCGFNATCNVECDGGHCGTGCGAGATCNVQCDGGSCAQACAPEASCNTECEGGGCS